MHVPPWVLWPMAVGAALFVGLVLFFIGVTVYAYLWHNSDDYNPWALEPGKDRFTKEMARKESIRATTGWKLVRSTSQGSVFYPRNTYIPDRGIRSERGRDYVRP